MIGLFDRDVFLKLGCCDLWHLACEALRVDKPYRLVSTSSEASNRRVIARHLPEQELDAAITRIMAIVAEVEVLSDDLVQGLATDDSFGRFGSVDGIDSGEQILAAVVLREPKGRVLVSGDKRFIYALQSDLPEDWERLKRSIISFEQCLLAIDAMFGSNIIAERATPRRLCDKSLDIALGREFSRQSFLDALRSYDPCT